MNAKRRSFLLILAAAGWRAGAAPAQGFAGLGSSVAEGFAMPRPGRPLIFPRDHGPHPRYRIEWWYLTANLSDTDGREYGVQWTLFRTALAPGEADGWQSPQLWLGNAGLTTAERHFSADRLARGGTGQAGARADPFAAWIDDWAMTVDDTADDVAVGSSLPLPPLRVRAGAGEGAARFAYDLTLRPAGPLVRHGEAGYSLKSAGGQASYYYSLPFIEVTGRIETGPAGSGAISRQVSGPGWIDREWSSQPLAAEQSGWDWFSLHLDGGAKLMAFQLRGTAGSGYRSGSWIAPDGQLTPLGPGDIRLEPLKAAEVAGRRVPVSWRVRVADSGLDVITEPLNPQSWMETRVPYWEGPIRFDGTVSGRGYLEMTGYAPD